MFRPKRCFEATDEVRRELVESHVAGVPVPRDEGPSKSGLANLSGTDQQDNREVLERFSESMRQKSRLEWWYFRHGVDDFTPPGSSHTRPYEAPAPVVASGRMPLLSSKALRRLAARQPLTSACYHRPAGGLAMTKQQILQAVEDLPEDAHLEDAIERFYLLLKIERGLAQADAGDTITQAEARRKMAQWLK